MFPVMGRYKRSEDPVISEVRKVTDFDEGSFHLLCYGHFLSDYFVQDRNAFVSERFDLVKVNRNEDPFGGNYYESVDHLLFHFNKAVMLIPKSNPTLVRRMKYPLLVLDHLGTGGTVQNWMNRFNFFCGETACERAALCNKIARLQYITEDLWEMNAVRSDLLLSIFEQRIFRGDTFKAKELVATMDHDQAIAVVKTVTATDVALTLDRLEIQFDEAHAQFYLSVAAARDEYELEAHC
jgi:hypothetical protein